MKQSKRDIAIILARANQQGNIRIKDHKDQKHHDIHHSKVKVVTAKNGKKVIEARSPR